MYRGGLGQRGPGWAGLNGGEGGGLGQWGPGGAGVHRGHTLGQRDPGGGLACTWGGLGQQGSREGRGGLSCTGERGQVSGEPEQASWAGRCALGGCGSTGVLDRRADMRHGGWGRGRRGGPGGGGHAEE